MIAISNNRIPHKSEIVHQPSLTVGLPGPSKAAPLVLFIALFLAAGAAPAQNWIHPRSFPPGSLVASNLDLTGIACSADGNKLVVCSAFTQGSLAWGTGLIFTSTNFGINWQTTSAVTNIWTAVASSADGSQLVAAGQSDVVASYGGIYISRDSGNTWSQSLNLVVTQLFSFPTRQWSLASSGSGQNLVAAVQGSTSFGIYYSTDAGNSWQASSGDGTTNNQWSSIASSADGTKMVVAGGAAVYRSTDSGATWSRAFSYPPNAVNGFYAVVSSADGSKLAVDGGTGMSVSTNSGDTWQANSAGPVMDWGGNMACSGDGVRLVAGNTPPPESPVYLSFDSGQNWVSTNNSPKTGLLGVCCSTNGTKLAGLMNSRVYLLSDNLTVTGHVYCSCDSNAIPGASIHIGTNSLTTDSDGAYVLTNLTAGDYQEMVSAANYSTVTNDVVFTAVYPVITNDIYLTNNAFLIIHPIFLPSITAMDGADAISNTLTEACLAYTNFIRDVFCAQIEFGNVTNGLAESYTTRLPLPYFRICSTTPICSPIRISR